MTNYISTGAARIIALLNASPIFQPNGKVRSITTFDSGVSYPAKKVRAPDQLPNARLRAASFQTQGFTGQGAMKTFGNTSPSGNTAYDFVIDKTVTYELVITYDGLDEVTPGIVETEVESVLFNAGITLGIAKAKQWGPLSGRYDQKQNPDTGGTLRVVQTILIPVLFHLHRADIITP